MFFIHTLVVGPFYDKKKNDKSYRSLKQSNKTETEQRHWRSSILYLNIYLIVYNDSHLQHSNTSLIFDSRLLNMWPLQEFPLKIVFWKKLPGH